MPESSARAYEINVDNIDQKKSSRREINESSDSDDMLAMSGNKSRPKAKLSTANRNDEEYSRAEQD